MTCSLETDRGSKLTFAQVESIIDVERLTPEPATVASARAVDVRAGADGHRRITGPRPMVNLGSPSAAQPTEPAGAGEAGGDEWDDY